MEHLQRKLKLNTITTQPWIHDKLWSQICNFNSLNLGQPHEHNTPAVEIAHVTYGEFLNKYLIVQ